MTRIPTQKRSIEKRNKIIEKGLNSCVKKDIITHQPQILQKVQESQQV